MAATAATTKMILFDNTCGHKRYDISISLLLLKESQSISHFVQLHLQKQDEGLEMLSQSAERLGKMSMTISDELGQQNKMLDEMDADLEMAGENLNMVTRKTRELIQKSGGGRTFVLIIGLILVVIILVFLILYT
jgi:t-SNARE complex subunit (syntaxin)